MARVPGSRPPLAFADPREEYIFTRQPIDKVADKWSGQKGHTRESVLKRHQTEGWDDQKQDYERVLVNERAAAFARKVADIESDEIVGAVKRHRQLGFMYQQVPISKQRVVEHRGDDGKVRKEVVFVDGGERVPLTGSDICRFGKEGVAMERRALGLADKIVQVQFAETFITEVWTVVAKYVDDPSVQRSIGRELEERLHKQFEMLEQQKRGLS